MLTKSRPHLAQNPSESKSANELCELLGDLPLALKVATAYLQKYHTETIAGYLEDLRQTPIDNPEMREVWACFAVSYRKLKRKDKIDVLALRLFHLAAYFAPVSISPTLLAKAANVDDAKRKDQVRFNTAMARLRDLGLICEEPDGRLLLHRLLRQFARSFCTLDLVKCGLRRPFRDRIASLRGLIPTSQPRVGRSVVRLLLKVPSSILLMLYAEVRVLLYRLRYLLNLAVRSRYRSGFPQRRVAQIVWEVLANSAARKIQNNLPHELTKERAHLRDAAVEAERFCPGLAANLYNLLGVHAHLSELLQEAKTDLERAVQIGERIYGVGLPDLVVFDSNLGMILREQGDLTMAWVYVSRAVQVYWQRYGPNHPVVASCLNNIGMILRDQGNSSEALEYVRQALKIRQRLFSHDDPHVAHSLSTIGLILQDQGDLPGALENTQRALAMNEQAYGPNHPSVASNARQISEILCAQGDLARAYEYAQRALESDEQVYGPNHPRVATDANNIGLILMDQGDLTRALEYFQRSLKIDEQAYGPNHSSVAVDSNNVGRILEDQGNPEGAQGHIGRALEILQKEYGPDNQTRRKIESNLRRVQEKIAAQASKKPPATNKLGGYSED
jgi:tetratricopeptide (TPR) repeat protein